MAHGDLTQLVRIRAELTCFVIYKSNRSSHAQVVNEDIVGESGVSCATVKFNLCLGKEKRELIQLMTFQNV